MVAPVVHSDGFNVDPGRCQSTVLHGSDRGHGPLLHGLRSTVFLQERAMPAIVPASVNGRGGEIHSRASSLQRGDSTACCILLPAPLRPTH